MPWSGSAGSKSFTRDNGTNSGEQTWQEDAAEPVDILATRHDIHDQDIADGINTALTKDGGNTATADIPFGGFKATNVGEAAARTQWARFSQLQDNKGEYVATVSGTDTILLTPSPVITAYAAGQRFTFIAAATNTGAATVNINSVGAKDIKRPDASFTALAAGDIISGTLVDIEYDGTRFQLLSWRSQAEVVLDTTPQLGGDLDANGHNILIDDSTGINDSDGNEQIVFKQSASAVNQIEIRNSASTNPVIINAEGDDTNIQLTLAGKGTGGVTAVFSSSTGCGLYDSNASHALQLKTSSNLTADRQLDFVTGDASRTVTLSGNLTVSGNATIPSGFTSIIGDISGLQTALDGKMTVETSSSESLTDYAVGSIVLAVTNSDPNRNAAVTLYKHNTNLYLITDASGGATALSGTWRAKGAIAGSYALFQRVA